MAGKPGRRLSTSRGASSFPGVDGAAGDEASANTAWLDEMNVVISSFSRNSRSERLYQRFADEAHVGLPQHLTLVLYRIGQLGTVDLADLVGEMEMSQSGVSRNVSELVALGLVSRTRSPRDHRAKVLQLTDAGQQVLERMWGVWNQALHAMTDDWTARQRREFLALFRQMAVVLEELVAADPATPPGQLPRGNRRGRAG
jgi:DNA-binding MarR family transcriptional regulator